MNGMKNPDHKALIARIEREAGVAGLLEILTKRLEPTDLQSLLLEVYSRLAMGISTKRLLEQYRNNRFLALSSIDRRTISEIERLAWNLLPPGFEPLELSPLCPLGTHSIVAGISQNRIVSTARNSEVVADPTNVLVLECALRRRRLREMPGRRRERVLLAASQRVVRAQLFTAHRHVAHFRLLTLCAAGRDEGSFRWEARQLVEQIGFYVRLIREVARFGSEFGSVRLAVTDFTGGLLTRILEQEVLQVIKNTLQPIECGFDPERTAGRNYYDRVCFKIFASTNAREEIELADGGPTVWTRTLLSDRKERLVSSGIGLERLCAAMAKG